MMTIKAWSFFFSIAGIWLDDDGDGEDIVFYSILLSHFLITTISMLVGDEDVN